MDPLREALLQAAESRQIRHVVETAPLSRSLVRRYVPGEAEREAVAACADLVGPGLTATLDHLGEDTTDVGPGPRGPGRLPHRAEPRSRTPG